MTTGNMSVGPLELVSLATPSGTPLRLAITYNSRNLQRGALGIGWTLNTEQRVNLLRPDGSPAPVAAYWSDVGKMSEFLRPAFAAANEFFPALPNTAHMTPARDGANMGFYFSAKGAVQLCPQQPCAPAEFEPRVVFEDGSAALFDAAGSFAGLRDVAGREQLYFSPGSGPLLYPAVSGLRQGARSVALHFDSMRTANAVATVGTISTTVARVLVDPSGYLTDICAPANPLNTLDCKRGAEVTDGCRAAGLRTLYRFQYASVPGDSTKRLSEVTDEACKTVERHDYQRQEGLGVVATTSESGRESLAFTFLNPGSAPRVDSVHITSHLAPSAPPAASQQVVSVASDRIIDASTNRVGAVDETCGCGASLERAWESPNGVPIIKSLRQGLTFSDYTYADGTRDPHGFGRPTGERQSDTRAGAWPISPEKTFTFAFQHPLVRRPTVITEPGISGVKTSVFDYDDDDAAHPCREGVTRNAGTVVPNEASTRLLCRVSEGGRLTRFRYDGQARLTRSEGPDGVPVTYSYYPDDDPDPLRAGMLASTTRGSGALALTTTIETYHFTGRPTRVVNANQEVTSYEFDTQGRITRMTAADTSETLTEYAAGNKPAKVTLASGATIHFEYDEWGRMVDVKWRKPTALGATLLQRRHRTYDKGGNVLVEETFDAAGLLTRRTQRDYDEAHRVTREFGLTPTEVKRFEYHQGLMTRSTDEAGWVSAFEYDGFARLRRTLRLVGGLPTSPITKYGYDVMDNLAEVVDANGNASQYFHDEFGQTLEVTTPNSGTTRYRYAIDGALQASQTESQRRAKEELRYGYDALRRPAGEFHTVYGSYPPTCFPGAPGFPPYCEPEIFFVLSDTALVTYGYDVGSHAKGRLSSVAFPGGTRTLTWDDSGRMQTESATLDGLSTPLPVTRTWHPGGALASLSYPRQTATSTPSLVQYDKGFDETVSEVRLGGVVLASGVTHYPFGGGLRGLARGNGIASSFDEDLLGRRVVLTGGPVNHNYILKPTGDVRQTEESGDVARTRQYGYDDEHRLTSAAVTGAASSLVFSETYSYDEVGNRLLKVRNGAKQYISIFDWQSGSGGTSSSVPANDLLRAVVDPPVGGGCVPADGGRVEPQDVGDERHFGGGHVDDGSEQGQGHWQHGQGHGYGHGEAASDAGAADGGLPICPTRTRQEWAHFEVEWKAIVNEAQRLVRDAPKLSSDEAHNRLLSVLEQLRVWMEKYDVPTPSLLGVLAGTKWGTEDFAATFSAYLTRRASGLDFGQEDLDLLETLVELAGKAEVRQAVENDPTWRYTHNASGAVTSVTVEIPRFILAQGVAGPIESPPIHNTMCYRYDVRQRLVQVETLVRSGAQLSSTTPPCEDAARVPMASFRYDEANRRVYANVAGKESWELRGPGGELLAEVSRAGEVERAYVYLDGEPLAVVALNPGKALRSPSTPLGCASTTGLSSWMLVLMLLAVFLRRRGAPAGALMMVLLMFFSTCEVEGEPPPGPAPAPGTAPGTIYYFHNDRLGTPVRLTNEAGATVWRADYRPFGDVQRLETDVDGDRVHVEQPLRFPGQYDDALSALILAQGPYYNLNRHYEPGTGRFLSPEPLLQNPDWVKREAQLGFSAPTYAYARNNPIRYTDPTGLAGGDPALQCSPIDSTVVCCIKKNLRNPQKCTGEGGEDTLPKGFKECAAKALAAFELCMAKPGADLDTCLVAMEKVFKNCLAKGPSACYPTSGSGGMGG